MNRTSFYHLIRAASDIIETERAKRGIDTQRHPARILIIGSQSILGSYSDEYLPEPACRSDEMDIGFIPSEEDEWSFDDPAKEFADYMDGILGEESRFRRQFGAYGQGVDMTTPILPTGWEQRVVPIDGREHGFTSTVACLDPYDLCAAKLARLSSKDKRYLAALIDTHVIDIDKLRERFNLIPRTAINPELRAWVDDFLNACTRFSNHDDITPTPATHTDDDWVEVRAYSRSTGEVRSYRRRKPHHH